MAWLRMNTFGGSSTGPQKSVGLTRLTLGSRKVDQSHARYAFVKNPMKQSCRLFKLTQH